MEVNGVFRCGDMGMNGAYSFKSLLLGDGEGMDEEGAHLALTGDLDGVEDSLYRDVNGRESFKSLLLDAGAMDESESQISSRNHKLENGNHLQVDLPSSSSAAAAALVDREKLERFLKDNEDTEPVEEARLEETRAPPRKKRRVNSNKVVAVENSLSEVSLVSLKDNGHITENGAEEQHQAQPSSTLVSPEKKQKVQFWGDPPPPRKRKQGGTSYDVQKLLDTVIAQQEMFFTDLLQSTERKFAIRERIREEKEDRWRAEERAQLSVFNNAMLVLTQEILGDTAGSTENLNERARSN